MMMASAQETTILCAEIGERPSCLQVLHLNVELSRSKALLGECVSSFGFEWPEDHFRGYRRG